MAWSDNQKGAAFMVASMSGFAISDTIFQLISHQVFLPQFLFMRGLIISMAIFWLAKRSGSPFPKKTKFRLMLIARGSCEILVAFCFLTALTQLPLAEATAINQTAPLVMSLAAFLFFGERLRLPRIGAIIIGFVGVLLIIKPGFGEFNPYYWLVVLAVLAISVRDFISRMMPAEISSAWVAFVTVFMVTIVSGLIGAFFPPMTLSPSLASSILILAFFVIIGHYTIVVAMRLGDVSFVAPFRYSAILLTVLIDMFLFGRSLDTFSLLGCVLVAGAGIFTLYREGQLKAQG